VLVKLRTTALTTSTLFKFRLYLYRIRRNNVSWLPLDFSPGQVDVIIGTLGRIRNKKCQVRLIVVGDNAKLLNVDLLLITLYDIFRIPSDTRSLFTHYGFRGSLYIDTVY